jgi:hypothetical protein
MVLLSVLLLAGRGGKGKEQISVGAGGAGRWGWGVVFCSCASAWHGVVAFELLGGASMEEDDGAG